MAVIPENLLVTAFLHPRSLKNCSVVGYFVLLIFTYQSCNLIDSKVRITCTLDIMVNVLPKCLFAAIFFFVLVKDTSEPLTE